MKVTYPTTALIVACDQQSDGYILRDLSREPKKIKSWSQRFSDQRGALVNVKYISVEVRQDFSFFNIFTLYV